MREPSWEEVKLIQEKLNSMRQTWEIVKRLSRSQNSGRRALQDLLRQVKSIEKMIILCLDGRAPHILREREVQSRRNRDWEKRTSI